MEQRLHLIHLRCNALFEWVLYLWYKCHDRSLLPKNLHSWFRRFGNFWGSFLRGPFRLDLGFLLGMLWSWILIAKRLKWQVGGDFSMKTFYKKRWTWTGSKPLECSLQLRLNLPASSSYLFPNALNGMIRCIRHLRFQIFVDQCPGLWSRVSSSFGLVPVQHLSVTACCYGCWP